MLRRRVRSLDTSEEVRTAGGGRATAQVGPQYAGQPAALRAGHTQSPLQLRHPQNTGSDGNQRCCYGLTAIVNVHEI
jgi:hypothetical protein